MTDDLAGEVHVDSKELLRRIMQIDTEADSLPYKIALDVAESIIENKLQSNADLNSLYLATRFKTSRTPVREALLMLEKTGLVAVPYRRRPHVVKLTLKDISNIYTLRAKLYAIVADLVVVNASEAQVQRLERIIQAMRSAFAKDDIDRYFWTNVLFHTESALYTGNHALHRSIDSLGVQVLRLRHVSMSLPGRIERSMDDHSRLLRAYQERDGALAGALSQSIILGALRSLESALGARSGAI